MVHADAQQCATTLKDSFASKSIDFCYLGGMNLSAIFSPGIDSTKITLYDTSRFFTEKNMPPFLWCPRLMFISPQYPVFSAGCKDAPDWAPSVKASLYKTPVDYLPRNSSRHSSKYTSRPMRHCLPMSSST
ncbi:hypothetical protein TNCV_2476551 [Trichonephila clavipes]|nr:hypothetical protein TNCV_2476551 [Trichonephila clavipes]